MQGEAPSDFMPFKRAQVNGVVCGLSDRGISDGRFIEACLAPDWANVDTLPAMGPFPGGTESAPRR